MSQVAERLITAEEFFLMPPPRDGSKQELVCGKVVTFMPGGVKHGQLGSRIDRKLSPFVYDHALGEVMINDTGFVLRRDPDLVRGPDVAFVRADRLSDPDQEGFYEGPPDLAVEVISPGDSRKEVADKVREYMDASTNRVWAVYPRTSIVVVHYVGGRTVSLRLADTLTSEHAGFEVEGFELKVADIFA